MNGASPTFACVLQDFFCQRLLAEQNASTRTIAAYRDSFRLFLRYAAERRRKAPTELTLGELDVALIIDFLRHLESDRGNSARSRNARLAAIRSFARYASFRDPTALPIMQRILAIPMKRFDRPLVGFLDHQDVETILAAPDQAAWSGCRDHAMFVTLYNTGARVSEVAAINVADVSFASGRAVRIHGKGRKDRVVPLWKSTAVVLKRWLTKTSTAPEAPLFPNRHGQRLSRSGIEERLRAALRKAGEHRPSLRKQKISPHTFRHTTAMHLLQSGVDITVIAMWLGHENPATTHLYIEADLAMKERALAKLTETPTRARRYKASDSLLAFLDTL